MKINPNKASTFSSALVALSVITAGCQAGQQEESIKTPIAQPTAVATKVPTEVPTLAPTETPIRILTQEDRINSIIENAESCPGLRVDYEGVVSALSTVGRETEARVLSCGYTELGTPKEICEQKGVAVPEGLTPILESNRRIHTGGLFGEPTVDNSVTVRCNPNVQDYKSFTLEFSDR